MANQVGEPAPVLELIDSTGKAKPLQAIQAPFTFVVFWDPTCGHCKEMLPRIDSIYAATWKAQGIKVYAVNVDEKHNAEWKKFVQRPGMQDWYHVYQREEDRKADADAGRPNFRQLYDIQTTPTLYLLDADKNIIAKKLSLEQFNEVIQARIKSKTK
jgi:protein-disulfide isomerase